MKYIWVKNQYKLSDPHEPAFLYATMSSFELGEMVYIDNKTGYAVSCPYEKVQKEANPIGRVLFRKKNLTRGLMNMEFVIKRRLMQADGKPENYAVNYELNRIIGI